MTVQSLDRHIAITPGTSGGRPRIAGHRITVETIATLHQQMGRSVHEICEEYSLSLAEVHAALAYYFDHKDEIDLARIEGEEFTAQLRKATPSILMQKLKVSRGE